MIELPLFLLIPLFSVIWVLKLTQPENIFDFVGRWFNELKSEKLKKMLYTCSACIAGQLAFWSGLFLFGIEAAFGGFRLEILYNWVALIVWCVFFAFVLETLINYFERN